MMQIFSPKHIIVAAFIVLFLILEVTVSRAATVDLGNGFFDHGVAVPISTHRGTVATIDGQGRDVVLIWLYDIRGGYALLMIDAETGKSEQFSMPFPIGGDGPFSSILSSGNKFYTHFGSHFCEFDPVKRGFTFFRKTTPQMAMSMTEDDQGVIWSVTYPNSGIVSFDPKTREFKDFGPTHKENWAQYPRSIALDDSGWLYFGIGNTASMILSFDPRTGIVKTMIPDSERGKGYATVYRDINGKVYGQTSDAAKGEWYEFYKGEGRKISKPINRKPKPYISSHQGLFHGMFPNGKQLKACDLAERILYVEDPIKKETTQVHFEYSSDGANIMGMMTSSDGTIFGGTAFPMHFFSFNPKTGQFVNRACYGQWNTLARGNDRFFIGGYTGGYLLEWDPLREWIPTKKGNKESNPRYLTESGPTIDRPHALRKYLDGRWIVMAGTPGYGYTGGGLLFWDRKTGNRILLEHTEIIPEHSTSSLVAIPNGKLLGGTTTNAGTGGEKKANEAVLYMMDMETKKIEWHQVVLPGVQEYTDMCSGPNGVVYGVADRKRFFVFDPATKKIIHEENTAAAIGLTISQQGPRVFVISTDQEVYMLFAKGIVLVDPKAFSLKLLAASPVPIGVGGDILNGRIYFGSGSHVYSYALPDKRLSN